MLSLKCHHEAQLLPEGNMSGGAARRGRAGECAGGRRRWRRRRGEPVERGMAAEHLRKRTRAARARSDGWRCACGFVDCGGRRRDGTRGM